METVVPPPADAELHLLTEWGDPSDRARVGRSALLSLLTHAAAVVFLLVVPETFMQPPHHELRAPVITPLIDPPTMLTQKLPNISKTIREMRSPDLSPRLPLPPGPSPEPQAPAPRKKVASPPPPPPPPPPKPIAPLPEPPKLEIVPNETPKLTLPVQTPQVPQPKARPAFEDVQPITQVPPNERVLQLPGPSVASAIRGALQGPGANTPGTAQIPSSGADLPQLLSDPQGIDFAPYLAHVLSAVRQYWNTIIPGLPSVKAGHKGLVSLQFAIQRDGTVAKIVFSQQTNDPSLNNAAVQAISGGGPFGPLPRQYQGLEIHVQMNFAYNVPRR
jgi:TonB family protein